MALANRKRCDKRCPGLIAMVIRGGQLAGHASVTGPGNTLAKRMGRHKGLNVPERRCQ
jgi:hypothetical protein